MNSTKRMKFFILLVVLFSSNLFGAWQDKIHPSIEVGMNFASFDGTLSNSASTPTSFGGDFGYSDAATSHFSLEVRSDYKYVPIVSVNYFHIIENEDVDLNKTMQVASYLFSGPTSTRIDYEVFNVLFSKGFKTKGRLVTLFGKKFYPGDVEYLVGVNIKYINWYFQIIDRKDTTSTYKFDRVESFIPLPYLGFKYFYYNFTLFSNISTLSLNEAKSMNYDIGVSYKVIQNLSLGVSFVYEDFEATEKQDKIKFITRGNKFFFRYKF